MKTAIIIILTAVSVGFAKTYSDFEVLAGTNTLRKCSAPFQVSEKQKQSIKPTEGTYVWNTTTKQYEYWDGSSWKVFLTK